MPYQMSNGKWRAKRMINGQTKTKVFPTKQEAKKWEAMQSAETWEAQEETLTPTTSLLDWANAYFRMAEERYVKSTLRQKRRAFRHLFKTINPSLTPDKLTPTLVMEMLSVVSKRVTPNEANCTRTHLSAAWAWGKKYFRLPYINPFAETERLPADKHPRYVPPAEDFQRVYAVADKPDQTLLLLLLHTGARRGEAFRLTWDDIDLQNRRIRLGTRKTGHGGMEYAWVRMSTELYEALAQHRQTAHPHHVFINQKGTGLTGRSYEKVMHNLCRKANVKPFCFHAIRHLTATVLAYGGLDFPSIQAVLRHKSPNTTARYIKSLGVDPAKLDAVFGKIKLASMQS